jgi:hypothetical protein
VNRSSPTCGGGLTFEQIAELAGSSAATVYRRYAAGLAAIRERLGVPCPEPNQIDPDLTLAAALRELAPQSAAEPRPHALRGRPGSGAPGVPVVWPVTAGGFALLAVVFAGVLAFSESQVQIVERERPVYVQVPVPVERPQPEVPPPSPEPALPLAVKPAPAEDHRAADARRMAGLRRDVLRWGVEMLPEPRTPTTPAQPPRDRELEEILRPTPGAYASPYRLPFRPPSIRTEGDE